MIRFSDTETISEALQRYFEYYGFKKGGYDDKWFRIKFIGPFVLTLPNIKPRVDAVKLHDIHHILTEYIADLRGEAEIGAWAQAATDTNASDRVVNTFSMDSPSRTIRGSN